MRSAKEIVELQNSALALKLSASIMGIECDFSYIPTMERETLIVKTTDMHYTFDIKGFSNKEVYITMLVKVREIIEEEGK